MINVLKEPVIERESAREKERRDTSRKKERGEKKCRQQLDDRITTDYYPVQSCSFTEDGETKSIHFIKVRDGSLFDP